MSELQKPSVKALLVADDDDDDYLLTRKALHDTQYAGELFRVKDGIELIEFLLKKVEEIGAASDEGCPHLLILLDLNMPRKDGRQALSEIRANHVLRCLPIVILTTSNATADINLAYELGANSYVRKPSSYARFAGLLKIIVEYWFEAVEWPIGRPSAARWQVL
jgi:CheY-like chemotaxis protein